MSSEVSSVPNPQVPSKANSYGRSTTFSSVAASALDAVATDVAAMSAEAHIFRPCRLVPGGWVREPSVCRVFIVFPSMCRCVARGERRSGSEDGEFVPVDLDRRMHRKGPGHESGP